MRTLTLIAVLLMATAVLADDDVRTVVGPSNTALFEGAEALKAGNARKGVQLTMQGLGMATNRRERLTGFANLCAGYVLLDELELALEYCNRALGLDERHWRSYSNRALIYVKLKRYEEAAEDIRIGQDLNPQSIQLKVVRSMLLDETDPVSPTIVIDDRRQGDKLNEES